MRKSVIPIERGVGIRRFVLSRCGAAAAEFALVFPVFMLCMFGITAFASTLFLENNMVNAARESVRQMAVLEAPFTAEYAMLIAALVVLVAIAAATLGESLTVVLNDAADCVEVGCV